MVVSCESDIAHRSFSPDGAAPLVAGAVAWDGETHDMTEVHLAMSVQWSERPPDFNSLPTEPEVGGSWETGAAWPQPGLFGASPYDGISLTSPQYGGSFGGYGSPGTYSLLTQLMSTIQQLLGQMGVGGSSSYGGEQYFSNATGASVGDPHLSFNGSTWNDMQSEPDLLNSNSIRGGYQLSTHTTAPNANGVTYNQRATVTTHDGQTSVTLDNDGTASVTQYGVTTQIAPGQSLQFGNETVTRNSDGSLQIVNTNENGGQITTTMRENGQGVDVNVSASNVDLGGAMVRQSSRS